MITLPKHVLLIKAHSMGIGDLLRSSAAWRAIKQKWPNASLHLLMLQKESNVSTEQFISSHHLLSSATFIKVKLETHKNSQKNISFAELKRRAVLQLEHVNFDLVIDCEPYGVTTSLLTCQLATARGVVSVGIAQFPLRKYFYSIASASSRQYRAQNHLGSPMDYAERDFVVLAILGVARNKTRIELALTAKALQWQILHAEKFKTSAKKVVLNIGCGTEDALPKRPDMNALVDAMFQFFLCQPFELHLSGASYEHEINERFMRLFAQRAAAFHLSPKMTNWAGHCALDELAGLIAQASIMISSDSGPYHMAVALKVPTVCWFNFYTPASHHDHHDVALLVNPRPITFADAAERLLAQRPVGV